MGFQQCAANGNDCGAPNGHDNGDNDSHSMLVYVILFGWCLIMTALMTAASVMAWGRIRALEHDYGHLALQVAETDSTIGEHMHLIPQVNQSVAQLREQTIEHDQHLHMMADSVDGIHYGLVQLGGYVQYNDLTPPQRRRMYEIERGNIVALNAMGQQQYLSTIRQQSRGYVRAGEDTHQPEEDDISMDESAEEENIEADAPVDPNATGASASITGSGQPGEWTTIVDDLRAQLNEGLAQAEYADAADIQRSVLLILDNHPHGGMADPATRSRVFHGLCANFASMALRAERNSANPLTIARYRSYEQMFRGRT
eukprot:s1089_g27.t1